MTLIAGLWLGLQGAVPFFILTLFMAWFFRDPRRQIPEDDGLFVSPADGRVVAIQSMPEGGSKISIFLSPLNVHINRIPCDGTVKSIQYKKGQFLGAFRHEASEKNEQNRIEMDTAWGPVAVTQIAGWLARRIVCHLEDGVTVKRGQKLGLIKFSSRTDIELPPGIEILVQQNQKLRGGESVIARLKSPQE